MAAGEGEVVVVVVVKCHERLELESGAVPALGPTTERYWLARTGLNVNGTCFPQQGKDLLRSA